MTCQPPPIPEDPTVGCFSSIALTRRSSGCTLRLALIPGVPGFPALRDIPAIAFEDNACRGKHSTDARVALRTGFQGGICEALLFLEADAANRAFVFIDGHQPSPPRRILLESKMIPRAMVSEALQAFQTGKCHQPWMNTIRMREPGRAFHPPRRSSLRPAQNSSGGVGVVSFFFSGTSVTRASVVRIIAATLAAFSRAVRVTLAGSMMPASTMSTYSPVSTL